MKIKIEQDTLTKKHGKNGDYYLQTAYADITNSDGSPKLYPREIKIFPRRDSNGQPMAYAKGNYMLSDSSFKVDEYENLTLGFLNLVPIK